MSDLTVANRVVVDRARARRYAGRRYRDVLATGVALVATAGGLAWLVLILGALLWKGFSGLSPAVFTHMTPPPGSSGGLLNPIFGSLVLTVIAILIGTPVGILAGTIWPNTAVMSASAVSCVSSTTSC